MRLKWTFILKNIFLQLIQNIKVNILLVERKNKLVKINIFLVERKNKLVKKNILLVELDNKLVKINM